MSTFYVDNYGHYYVRDAELYSKNFSGEKFGRGGTPGICLKIDSDDLLNSLERDGFNIKNKTFDDGSEVCYLPIIIGFDSKYGDPEITFYTRHGARELTKNTVEILDNARMETIWIEFKKAKTGISAYLQSFKATESSSYKDDYPVPDFGAIPPEDMPFCE